MTREASGLKLEASPIHGTGVFACRLSRKGDVVHVLDDSRVVTPENPLDWDKGEFEHHCDWLAKGRQILMGIPERCINHCCESNTFVKTGEDKLRRMIALSDIKPGEEITYDYLLNCHGGVVWTCACGHQNCRKTMLASFFDLPLSEQRAQRHLLDSWFVEEHRSREVFRNG